MSETPQDQSKHEPSTPANRRTFITATLAVVTGAFAALTPLAIGVVSYLSPLFRKSKSPEVRVALLSQVPDDGKPRYFPVSVDRTDAWNRYPQQKVGAVYAVRHQGEDLPTIFTAKCPHAGCFVGYAEGDTTFKCPCHTSSFNLDGSRVRGDDEVSPRDMDRLPVSLKEISTSGGEKVTEVWIEFIDFQTGHAEQVPTT